MPHRIHVPLDGIEFVGVDGETKFEVSDDGVEFPPPEAGDHTHEQADIDNLVTDLAAKQPIDSDLTAIAALTTTATGRSLLAAADAAAIRTIAGAETSGAAAAAQSASQPVDSDLTAIAALTTTAYGRAFLALADAAAAKTALSLAKADVGLSNVDNTADSAKPVSTAQQTALDGKQTLDSDLTAIAALTTTATGRSLLEAADAAAIRTIASAQPSDADLTTIAGLTATTDNFIQAKSSAWASRTPAQVKTDLALVKGDVGLGNVDNVQQQPIDTDLTTIAGLTATTDNFLQAKSSAWASRTPAQVKTDLAINNVDNTSDAGKPVSTAQQTALDLKAPITSVPNASYRTLMDSSGSHIAARTNSTYGLGHGDPAAITGVGTLYPLNTIYIDDADYPTLNGVAPKLRIRAQIYVNDVAPTGNYTVGLHPVTRPGTSGSAGVLIYTIGAAVSGSTAVVNTPAVDSSNMLVGSDFAVPADGHYILGFVSTATVATSSHLHISATLQMRNA